jgi:hypothetical protein
VAPAAHRSGPVKGPPRAGSASLEGSRLPRAGSASLEGSPPPRSRLSRTRTRSRMRVRTFNALTRQSHAITRGRDAPTSATVPRTGHRQQPPRARLRTSRPTTTPSPSKPPLFKYGTRHNDKTGARATRTAANSPALHAIPPHVAK